MNLAILGSHRPDSNTEKALMNNAPWTNFETIVLLGHTIGPYLYDSKHTDDFLAIADKMVASEEIVFATPVYWYAMSGLMKNFFDRFTDLITTHKSVGRSLAGKNCHLLACGADSAMPEGFAVPFAKTCEYFSMRLESVRYVQIK